MNLTLVGQMLTFAVLVYFIHRFLWGPITGMLAERNRRVADGLAAAERGKRELELAEKRASEVADEAKAQAQEIIGLAERRASEVADEAKAQARSEAERIVKAARADVVQEINRAREQLRARVAELAVVGAGRILQREVDPAAHAKLLETVTKQL